MLDLTSEEVKLPYYEVQYEVEGEKKVKKYDPIPIAFKLDALAGIEDPQLITSKTCEIFDIPMSTYQALTLLDDFTAFMKPYEERLKNLLGRLRPSATT